MLPFGQVDGDWSDKPVFLIGGGPSLRPHKEFLRDLRNHGYVLACNRAAFGIDAPALCSVDQHWVRMDRVEIHNFIKAGGEAYLAVPPNEQGHPAISGAVYLRRIRGDQLSKDPRDITALHSGFGALGVAYHKRAKKVYLLGYDMAYDKGNTHWHQGYKWHVRTAHKFMPRWANHFHASRHLLDEAGVEVINVLAGDTPDGVGAFPTIQIEDLICPTL